MDGKAPACAATLPVNSQMLQALREALEAAAPLGTGSSGRGGSSTGESIREGLVQVGALLCN